MSVDTLIAGGAIATHESIFEASIAIDDGKIVGIGTASAMPEASTSIDAREKIVMPGVVDPHVHIDETDMQVGTYESETEAAALGGVTTVIDFAWQDGLYVRELDQGATLRESIDVKRQRGEQGIIDFSFHGALTREEQSPRDEIDAALEAGVTSFKLFLAEYDGTGISRGFVDAEFRHLGEIGAVAVVHSEDPTTCARLTETAKKENRDNPTEFPATRPAYAEAMAVESVARLAGEWGVKYYNVHTSSHEAAAVLAQAQEAGIQARGETCPHYLVFDKSAYEEQGNLVLITPPLRTREDVSSLYDCLENDVLSTIGTDHCVYTKDSKTGSWWDSPRGANGIQESLALVHHEAVNRRGFSYPGSRQHDEQEPSKNVRNATERDP
ncbi:MAG: amidohydrolase family protein [Halodesulfurarchaeum sp.]|nr:amidohydrolase family protein [Halodesulfurarchaeum sp.]